MTRFNTGEDEGRKKNQSEKMRVYTEQQRIEFDASCSFVDSQNMYPLDLEGKIGPTTCNCEVRRDEPRGRQSKSTSSTPAAPQLHLTGRGSN